MNALEEEIESSTTKGIEGNWILERTHARKMGKEYALITKKYSSFHTEPYEQITEMN